MSFVRTVFGNKKVVLGAVTAPTTDANGQFTIDTGLKNIHECVVIPSPTQLLEANNTAYSMSYTHSGGVITVTIKTIDVTAAAPVSWTALASTTLTGVTFRILAFGD